MKKILSLLFVALLTMSAWADTTVTFIPGETVGTNTSANALDQMSRDGVIISCTSGAFLANPYRFGGGSTTTITSTEGNIKKIEFTCSASYGNNYGPDQFYGDGYSSHSGSNVGIWQGDADRVVLHNASQSRCTKIVVTLSEEVVTELVPPVFHPNGGEFTGSLAVTLTCPTENASIFYWEGTEEEQGVWNHYNGEFYVTETKTYTAVSTKGTEMSEYVTVTFTKVVQTVEAPVFTPAGGTFSDRIDVTLACATPNAKIFYSLDNELWSQYEGAIPVTDDITIWAKAKVGDVESEVVSATYTKLVGETTEIIYDPKVDFGDGTVQHRGHFSVVKGPVTMYVGDGMISSAGHYAIYGPNDSSALNFTSVGAPIVKIEFYGLFGYAAKHLSLATGIDGTFTTSGDDGVWEGNAYFVDFNINMQARFTKIVVTVAGTYLRGDVNKDGRVRIDDVTTLIDALLIGNAYVETDDYSPLNADVDEDTNVNIVDVTALIDILLSDGAPTE